MRVEIRERLEGRDRAEWEAVLAAARRQHPRQDPRFAGIEQADGAHVLFATGYGPEGAPAALALLSLRPHPRLPGFAEATALSGPVAEDGAALSAFLTALLAHPALRRTGRLHASPYWTGEAAGEAAALLAGLGFRSTEGATLRRTGLVALDGTREAMAARFSKSARRELRRAGRQGVEIAPVTELAEALEVLESLNRLRAARGLAPVARAGFEAGFAPVYRTAGTGIIFAARASGRLAGSLILYRGAHVAHGRHFAPEPGVLRELSNLRISPALWLEGMVWAGQAGCTHLDVEGWQADVAPDDPRHAIYKYKGELGPEETPRVAEHYRPINRLLNAPGPGLVKLRRRALGRLARLLG